MSSLPDPNVDKGNIKWDEIPFNTHNLLTYCLWYKNDIYVRHFNAFLNEWETRPISEIPGGELLAHLEEWTFKGIYPHRIVIREDKVERPHE